MLCVEGLGAEGVTQRGVRFGEESVSLSFLAEQGKFPI